jgi:hypothetical protein
MLIIAKMRGEYLHLGLPDASGFQRRLFRRY